MNSMLQSIMSTQSAADAKRAEEAARNARHWKMITERKHALQTFIDEFNELNYKITDLIFSGSYCSISSQLTAPACRVYLVWDNQNLHAVYNYAPTLNDEITRISGQRMKPGTLKPSLWKAEYLSLNELTAYLNFFKNCTESGMGHVTCNQSASKLVLTVERDGRYKWHNDYEHKEPTFFPDEAADWITKMVSSKMKLLPVETVAKPKRKKS